MDSSSVGTEVAGTPEASAPPNGGGRRVRERGDAVVLSRPSLRDLFKPSTLASLVSVWLAGCLVALVTATPYIGDDNVNKDIRAIAGEAGQSLFGITAHYTTQWMANEGRFFPGSLGWTYTAFWYTGSRVAYKFVIAGILVGAVVAFALLAARLTGRWRVAALFVPIAVGVMQIRLGFDALIGFAGLVPLTAGICALVVLMLVSRRGWPWAVAAAVLYGLALITYETVLFFAPIMIAVVVSARRAWRPAIAIVVPALVQSAIVAYLRLTLAAPPNPAYTVNLEPSAVLRTFWHQFTAAIPLSQWIFSVPNAPRITHGYVAVALVVVGIPAFVAVVALARTPFRAAPRMIVALAAFGAWMWVTSSGIVSVSARWQTELGPGQGYLAVAYGYFGVALLVLAAYLAVERAMSRRDARLFTAWVYVGATALAALVTVTFAGNIAVTSAMW